MVILRFLFVHLFCFVGRAQAHAYRTYMWVRGRLQGAGSLLPPCGIEDGTQDIRHALECLPRELPPWPYTGSLDRASLIQYLQVKMLCLLFPVGVMGWCVTQKFKYLLDCLPKTNTPRLIKCRDTLVLPCPATWESY